MRQQELWAGSTHVFSLQYPKPLKGHLVSSCFFPPSISNCFHRRHNFSVPKELVAQSILKTSCKAPSQLKKKAGRTLNSMLFLRDSIFLMFLMRAAPTPHSCLGSATSVHEEPLSLTCLSDSPRSSMRRVSHKPMSQHVSLPIGPANLGEKKLIFSTLTCLWLLQCSAGNKSSLLLLANSFNCSKIHTQP